MQLEYQQQAQLTQTHLPQQALLLGGGLEQREAAWEVGREAGESGLRKKKFGEDEFLGVVAIFGLKLGPPEALGRVLGGWTVAEEEVYGEGEDVLEDDLLGNEEGDDGHSEGHLPHLSVDLHAVLHIRLQDHRKGQTRPIDPDALLILDVVLQLCNFSMGHNKKLNFDPILVLGMHYPFDGEEG